MFICTIFDMDRMGSAWQAFSRKFIIRGGSMKAWLVVGAVVLAQGCGKCEESDLDGTYIISFRERSGDCGPQTEAVINYNDGKGVGVDDGGGDCTTAYDTMTEKNCTNETKGTCQYPSDDLVAETTFSMTEDDKGGEKYIGVMELDISQLSTGDYICSSTYDVTARRR